MTKKELKRKSAMLVNILAHEHFHNYAKQLISTILKTKNKR